MDKYEPLLEKFTEESKRILGDDLVGIYLHGSAVMGCFNPKKSDIDLIIVVENEPDDEIKKEYMDMVVKANEEAPAKGIEMSIIRKNVCDPFVYPTPFELHFSTAHLEWYKSDADDYVKKMNGEDKDLAAHVTIINHRGKTLFGRPINEVFGKVSRQDYFDSIWNDIKDAKEDITEDTMYIVLNLARVLAYARDNAILSKKEGGKWGIENIDEKYHSLIRSALEEYENSAAADYDIELAQEYAVYMLDEIRKYRYV